MYYIDGYHGGIHGHMPLGCWRDVIEALHDHPEWKISLDIEPVSWDCLKERDPLSYMEISTMLKDQSVASRLEIVAGSFAQPYGWVVDGESNIRHIEMGMAAIRRHFPWIPIKTYAVQEPCWTSALPQILRSFRFERAVLKNPSTAWAGYSAGFDAEILWWEGPDGSRIKTVPRYACEELISLWATESYRGKKEFIDKCAGAGIHKPAGMSLQDLGWPARPQLPDDFAKSSRNPGGHIIYTTWKEYFEQIASEPEQVWKVSQEDILGALPWGDQLLVKMERQIRSGEALVLSAERLKALVSFITGGSLPQSLDPAWQQLLLAQHHDAFICAPTMRGEESWAWKTSAHMFAACECAAKAVGESMAAISGCVRESMTSSGSPDSDTGECDDRDAGRQESICAVNLLARTEYRAVAAEVTAKRGINSFRVYDGDVLLESQYKPVRLYEDGSKNAGILLFNAYFTGLSARTFRIEPSKENDVVYDSSAHASIEEDFAYLETDFYRITIDLRHGGIIASLYDKRRDVEVARSEGELRFNEYKGYFIQEQAFLSSATQRAEAQLVSDGPLEAAIDICGRIGRVNFTQHISIMKGDEKISVNVVFDFPDGTRIGDPHEVWPSDSKEDDHRSYLDSRYKLNAYFPTAFIQKKIYKDAAFDVCGSRLENTHFKSYYEIKHNIILGWVDGCDDEQGLAIMTDHTTSYAHGDVFPLALTLAWGGDGGFWWGRRQLSGKHSLSYAIVPHRGDYCQGDIWHTYQKMKHQTMSRRVLGNAMAVNPFNLLAVEGSISLSAAYMDEKGMLIARFFNPGASTNARITINASNVIVELTELDGSVVSRLDPVPIAGGHAVNLEIPAFSIRTLRINLGKR